MTDALDSNSTQIPTQMARYLSGECSAAEVAAFERWVGEDPARATLVDRLRAEWERAARVPPEASLPRPVDTRAGWGALTRRLGLDGGAGRHSRTVAVPSRSEELARGTSRVQSTVRAQHLGVALLQLRPQGVGERASWRWTAVAAAVMVAFGLGLALGVGRYRAPFGRGAGREYATAAGQRLSVTLVDGTRLTLAPASRMRVGANYGRDIREVTLEGEAFFHVRHDAKQPFIVRTSSTVTRDLGTAFDVRAYRGDSITRVVVRQGRVAVAAPAARRAVAGGVGDRGAQVELGAGEAGEIGPQGLIGSVRAVRVDESLAWVDGHLVFRDTPLRDVLAELARWYDLEIMPVDPSLAERPVTATFEESSGAEEALADLEAALRVRIDRHGRLVSVIGSRGQP